MGQACRKNDVIEEEVQTEQLPIQFTEYQEIQEDGTLRHNAENIVTICAHMSNSCNEELNHQSLQFSIHESHCTPNFLAESSNQ